MGVDPSVALELETDVIRWDSVTLRSPRETADGYLRLDGVIAHSGILSYTDAKSGRTVKEYRSPATCLDNLDSYTALPVTLDHPPSLLTADNARQYTVGAMGTPRMVGDELISEIVLHDRRAIQAARSGHNKLSLGYRSRILSTPGQSPSGERYDHEQTSIRPNHLALVREGRAPRARVRMDASSAFAADIFDNEESTPMEEREITIGGATYKVPAAVADALSSATAKMDAAIAAQETAQTAEADKARTDSIAVEVAARLDVAAKAAPILDRKLDEVARMDSLEIMREVVAKISPALKLEGQDAAYVRGAFEHIVSTYKAPINTSEKIAEAAKVLPKVGEKAVERMDAASLEMKARQRDAAKWMSTKVREDLI